MRESNSRERAARAETHPHVEYHASHGYSTLCLPE